MYCRGIPTLVYSLSSRGVEVDGDDGPLHHCDYHNQSVKGGSGDGDSGRVHHHCGHSNQDVENDSDGDAPRRCSHCVWIVVERSDDDDPHRCGRHDTSVDENSGYHRLDGGDECPPCDGGVCLYSANIEHSPRRSDHMG